MLLLSNSLSYSNSQVSLVDFLFDIADGTERPMGSRARCSMCVCELLTYSLSLSLSVCLCVCLCMVNRVLFLPTSLRFMSCPVMSCPVLCSLVLIHLFSLIAVTVSLEPDELHARFEGSQFFQAVVGLRALLGRGARGAAGGRIVGREDSRCVCLCDTSRSLFLFASCVEQRLSLSCVSCYDCYRVLLVITCPYCRLRLCFGLVIC